MSVTFASVAVFPALGVYQEEPAASQRRWPVTEALGSAGSGYIRHH
jgi:hypothetical protein